MFSTMLGLMEQLLQLSLLGCLEVASAAAFIYYIFAKTRAPVVLAGLFPYLRLGTLNNMGSLIRSDGKKSEAKAERPVLAHGLGTENMLKVTPHAGRKPFNSLFDWGVYFPFVAQSVRSKKFQYPQVVNLVQKDPLLQLTIKQAAEQILREEKSLGCKGGNENQQPVHESFSEAEEKSKAYNEILRKQELRAISILSNMRSTLNNFLLALTSWILYRLLPCFLSGVITHTQQIKMLKAASERAPGTPLIFLPLHRSHLDYIMVTFILTNNDIRSPLVAAGDNLQIPVFGGLLRGLGAFFIKRKIDPVVGKKDILYRAILHLYLLHALKKGHNVEFFIEGGRTRTGKPCMPKGGILSVIVNAFMDGSIPDALLVPVSVNYERLVDGNFVREQTGEKKEPESFGKAIAAIWKAVNSSYGLMRIDFNEPYSIRELVQSYNKIARDDGTLKVYKPAARKLQHNQSTSSLYGTDVVCEEHRTLIESISRQVVYDCAAATSVMSTNALAFLFLTRFREGAPEKELANGLDDLRQTLKGRKDMAFAGASIDIVNYAFDLLGSDLVTRAQDETGNVVLRPVQTVSSFIELAYYSNVLTPHFALQSILLTTFHNLLPPKDPAATGKTSLIGVSQTKLIEAALENCEIYRYEYILNKPTKSLENLLELSLDNLVLDGMLQMNRNLSQEDEHETRRIANAVEYLLNDYDDENAYPNSEEEETIDLLLAPDTICGQKALCEALAPFSHSYLAVAQCLHILYKNPMLETEFIKFVINDLTTKYKNKSCPYAESISTDSVKNCIKLLEKWSAVEICNQHGLRLLSLGTLYEVSKESVKTVVQRINAIVPNYKNGYF